MLKRLIIVAFLVGLFFCSAAIAEFGSNSSVFTNTYCSIKKGQRAIYVHPPKNGKRDYKYYDIVNTEIIDGVSCLKVIMVDTFNQWFSILWLAQDTQGNIYMLQALDTELEPPLFFGKDNAILYMPATINIGDIIGNTHKVTEMGVTVEQLSTGLGPYTNCLKTVEDDGDIVYYAPNVGDVKKEASNDSTRSYELKEVILGNSASDGGSTIDDTLKITIPSLLYKGVDLGITAVLEYYPNIADPSGLYWKLTSITNND